MMKRTTFLVFAISCLLLATTIAMNLELFFFAKVISATASEWTRPFGDPYIASSVLVMLSLLPAAWWPASHVDALKAWAAALVLAPLPAVGLHFGDSMLGNMLFQYVWALMLGCVPAALVALALGALVRKLMRSS